MLEEVEKMSQMQMKNFVQFSGVQSCSSAVSREEFCTTIPTSWGRLLQSFYSQSAKRQQHLNRMVVLKTVGSFGQGSYSKYKEGLLLLTGTLQFCISIFNFCNSNLSCGNLSVFNKVSGILSNWSIKFLFQVISGELCWKKKENQKKPTHNFLPWENTVAVFNRGFYHQNHSLQESQLQRWLESWVSFHPSQSYHNFTWQVGRVVLT